MKNSVLELIRGDHYLYFKRLYSYRGSQLLYTVELIDLEEYADEGVVEWVRSYSKKANKVLPLVNIIKVIYKYYNNYYKVSTGDIPLIKWLHLMYNKEYMKYHDANHGICDKIYPTWSKRVKQEIIKRGFTSGPEYTPSQKFYLYTIPRGLYSIKCWDKASDKLYRYFSGVALSGFIHIQIPKSYY